MPLVGNSDTHRLWQLGTTYTLLDAEKRTIDSVFEAVRAGRTRVVTAPLKPLDKLRGLLPKRPFHEVWTRALERAASSASRLS